MREQKAQMHEKGMADHELIDDAERDRFAGTSATASDEPAPMRDDASTTGTGTTGATSADGRPMHEPETEYQQGREDEAAMREGRFSRDDETARTDEPSTTRRDA
jgi:hypothetical protein